MDLIYTFEYEGCSLRYEFILVDFGSVIIDTDNNYWEYDDYEVCTFSTSRWFAETSCYAIEQYRRRIL